MRRDDGLDWGVVRGKMEGRRGLVRAVVCALGGWSRDAKRAEEGDMRCVEMVSVHQHGLPCCRVGGKSMQSR